MSTVVRRHRNKIQCIKDSVGNWIMDEKEMKEHIRNGFKDLYTTELCSVLVSSTVLKFSYCHLSNEESIRISKNVTNEEIRSCLWSLKAFKALGPDELHAGFFQHF